METYLLAGLIAAAVTGLPFAAQAASHATYANAIHLRQQQLGTKHQVEAVLTEQADTVVNGYTLSGKLPAKATWTYAGVRQSGEVLAQAGSAKGTMITIWIDASGKLTSPPLTTGQVAGQADAAAVGAGLGVVVVFLAGVGTTRYVLYRRRMSAWDVDWQITARTWNHQSW